MAGSFKDLIVYQKAFEQDVRHDQFVPTLPSPGEKDDTLENPGGGVDFILLTVL